MTQPRKARGVTEKSKASAINRLRRIEGQVRGLQKMIEDERYCADVLIQISSVQQALEGVSKVLLKHHLDHCVTHALQSGGAARAGQVTSELVDLIARHWR